jgi:hypothetical protein
MGGRGEIESRRSDAAFLLDASTPFTFPPPPPSFTFPPPTEESGIFFRDFTVSA